MARAPWRPILQGRAHPEPVIETLGGTLQAQMPANQVPVNNVNFPGIIMPTPRRGWQDIPLAEEVADTSQVTLHPDLPPAFMVNVGNPHAVIFVDGGTAGLAAQYGFELEKNRLLPEGANINFAACTGDNIIELDTWERGAGLTQACGTGACATAVAAFHLGKIDNHNNEFRIEPPCARDPELKNNSDRAGIHQDNLLEILVDYDGHSLPSRGRWHSSLKLNLKPGRYHERQSRKFRLSAQRAGRRCGTSRGENGRPRQNHHH